MGRKHRMVPQASPGGDRSPAGGALCSVPEHAYLVVAEARIDGQPAFRLRDAVTREELVATHEELVSNGAGVSLSDR